MNLKIALVLVLSCLLPATAFAEAVVGAKAGDRVVDVMGTQGTVVQVGTGDEDGNYLVMWDYQKTQSPPKAMWVRPHGQRGSLWKLGAGGSKVDVNDPVGGNAWDAQNMGAASRSGNPSSAQTSNGGEGTASGANVGDRVIDVMGTVGTVVKVGTGDEQGNYLVMWDYQKTQSSPTAMWVRPHGQKGSLWKLGPGGSKVDVNAGPPARPQGAAPSYEQSTYSRNISPRSGSGSSNNAPTAIAAPAGNIAPSAPPTSAAPKVNLTPLAKKAFTVRGRAVTASGQPIQDFEAWASGHTGKFDPFLGTASRKLGSAERLGQAKGVNGQYEFKIPSAKVIEVSAIAKIPYRGMVYTMGLHPTDGKANGTSPGDFQAEAESGIVRDFVLRISGLAPGIKGREIYYGGELFLDYSLFPGSKPPGSIITLTLTPSGPLLDGSQGKTLTWQLPVEGMNMGSTVLDIPIGAYSVNAALNGKPLKMGFTATRSNEFKNSEEILFKPSHSSDRAESIRLYMIP
ncbi:MAG: hypothetical protein K2X77_05325 [Candidatus Obscuribacterales bacterium]|nr:hypothetical protein [Candidatus Obscuribacterales bacterium]